MVRTRLGIAAWLVASGVLTFASGCGGRAVVSEQDAGPPVATGAGTSSGGASAGGSGASGGGAGPTTPDGYVGVCPLGSQAPGDVCSGGLHCEYGTDPNPKCNSLLACFEDHWLNLNGIGTGSTTCPSPGIQHGCPASRAAVEPGAACTIAGLECGYPEGRCACAAQYAYLTDGGAGEWWCEAPAAGCPMPRPHVGTACDAPDSLRCDYGSAFLAGGTVQSCIHGAWQ
jgi:hypothetical protein